MDNAKGSEDTQVLRVSQAVQPPELAEAGVQSLVVVVVQVGLQLPFQCCR
jgi:hypothetical protein